MRPRLIELLNSPFHTAVFTWLVPPQSLMYVIGVTAVLLVFMLRVRRQGLSDYHASGLVISAMLGGLLGARIIYMLFYWRETLADPRQILSISGGTTSWGAYLGGFAGILVYFRLSRPRESDGTPIRKSPPSLASLDRLRLLDVLASCLGLGIFFGRMACFLNGDDFGKVTSLPWGVRFPLGSYPWLAQYSAGLLKPDAVLSLPVHPVQLYLSLKGMILFIALSLVYVHLKDRPGLTFGIFWLSYGILRFAGEFFRGDHPVVLFGVFNAAQVVCVLVIFASALWLVIMDRRRKLYSN
jgi:phosphatidylglycerol:prolipoprotein diacylglycerol transferase